MTLSRPRAKWPTPIGASALRESCRDGGNGRKMSRLSMMFISPNKEGCINASLDQ